MSNVTKLRKGLTIKLKGKPEKVYVRVNCAGDYSIYPSDFPMMVPRLLVREGDSVKAGTPLFHDKRDARVRFCSPVSGVVRAIERAERRRIVRLVIHCDDAENIEYEEHGPLEPAKLSAEQVVDRLLEGGCWPFVRQRPFNVIAEPNVKPRAIFISTFDLAPLAPDIDFAIKDDGAAFQCGLEALQRVAPGEVHLGLCSDYPANPAFENAKGVQKHYFHGKYPVSNVGVQLHHVAPVSKGEVVWTLHPLDVVVIGRLFMSGRFDARRIVALSGSRVERPRYYLGILGMPLSPLLEDGRLVNKKTTPRIISGNVLTGRQETQEGCLHFYDTQVTVIPEGGHRELFGWLAPGWGKFSASRLFPSYLMPSRTYDLDTSLHGGVRSFVMTGDYERVFPMRIYPVQLIKSILADDIEGMENLGIYEVSEEDFALCDFVCTSKIEAQSIVRAGLNRMVEETR